DAFVVRDLKIIEGTKGSFVAMPSRKLTDRCPQCGCKNHLRARFCNQCGGKLDEDRATRDAHARANLPPHLAPPTHSPSPHAVLKGDQEERERSKQPRARCTYDDYDGDDFEGSYSPLVGELNGPGRKEGYRAHGAHGPRGAHGALPQGQAPVAAQEERHAETG